MKRLANQFADKFSKFRPSKSSPLDPSLPPVHLYHAHNIHTLDWPDQEENKGAQQFLTALVQNGISYYIENIKSEMQILKVREHLLPITINQGEYDNSYVCSPYGHYVSYPLECLDIVDHPLLRKGIRGLLKGLGIMLRWGKINQVIIVNNWLFSTNLYPPLQEEDFLAIIQALTHHFPHHAIVFRSIDSYLNPPYCELLKKNQCHLIASRQIYFTDAKKDSIFETRIFKSDLRLLKKSEYELTAMTTLSEEEQKRVLDLYNNLYIDKYSTLNPKFNHRFIQLALQNQIFHMRVLKR